MTTKMVTDRQMFFKSSRQREMLGIFFMFRVECLERFISLLRVVEDCLLVYG